MKVRPLRASDIPVLKAMYERAGFDYEWPDLTSREFEAIEVVVNERDEPLMAAAAKRTVELYLFAGEMEHPAAKLHAIRLLHVALADALKAKGYSEANAFLPPQIEKSFGRRLMRTFGWLKSWSGYFVKF